MLSITKIHAAAHQAIHAKDGKGYLHYLGGPSSPQRSDFDEYARGNEHHQGPLPFWACKGAALLGLDDIAEAEQVERLARGFHPVTGLPLVKGAGDSHVMGLDMTFSAPKDFSAVFAGSDRSTRDALIECLQSSARAALEYAESAAVTRHGHGGRVKQLAEAAISACYTHFASRALDPQLHVHAFMFNVGKRKDTSDWSALEHRPQFERKLATGILFRVELASRLKALGFQIDPAGPYFAIRGIDDAQRMALSSRSRQIAEHLAERGLLEPNGAAKELAALGTREAKSEPPLPELLARFEAQARELGLTPETIASMRSREPSMEADFALDHAALLEELTATQSCSTAQEALALICEKAMGQWSAARCLAELDRFLEHAQVVRLGQTELLTEVFTSKATQELEALISQRASAGRHDTAHRLDRLALHRDFDRLESELQAKLGVPVSLAQQRAAALHIATETGSHAFVEGWAGTGKTTMLKALGGAYRSAGFEPTGCCQSAAAAQNLARETGIPSRTIASLLLALREGRSSLSPRSIVVLDEAGMVGSREFSLLQEQVVNAGAKLVCVGDPKQLQPIEAGGIFRSLMKLHGKSEISSIQRQRTDFEPLLQWLDARARKPHGGLNKEQAQALREAPDEARLEALAALCAKDPHLERAFSRWKARFDFEWMREAVEQLATGQALEALRLLDSKKRLRLMPNHEQARDSLIADWAADKTPLASKAIVAATRAEVAELNAKARDILIERGLIDIAQEVQAEIIFRDETRAQRAFAPGDRIVFTLNDRALGVANGVTARIRSMDLSTGDPTMTVELDDPNERNERVLQVPVSFGRFDHAYCLTNHKSQGRTFDAAYVLANPSMADREWSYVAASRSRFATTLYVNSSLLGLIDPESHREEDRHPKSRAAAIEALSLRMRRSRAKGTSLDHAEPSTPSIAETAPQTGAARPSALSFSLHQARALLAKISARSRALHP